MSSPLNPTASEKRLTRYAPGSLLELWAIGWPLMLAGLSGTLMVFVDRAVLASYQSEAFNACAATQPWFWTVEMVSMAFIVGTEFLIGRLNGEGQYKRMGPFVWQMVTVCAVWYIFLLPIYWHVDSLLASNIKDLGAPYLRQLLLTLPFEMAGFGAIGAFFIGRGETRKIPIVLLIVNVINAMLDIWFVFGGCGLPAMGIWGAALATNVSSLWAFVMFLWFFLNKKYREKYAINTFHWSWPLLLKCFRMGLPNAISCGIIMMGWATIYQVFSEYLSPPVFKAYCVAFTIYNFMYFVIDGTGKSVGTLCSNFLGAKQPQLVRCVLKQSVRFTCIFGVIFLIVVLCSKPLVQFLASKEFANDATFQTQVSIFLGWYWVMLFFETARLTIQAFLFALFKIKEILIANVVCTWGIALVPTYYNVVYFGGQSPAIYQQLSILDMAFILIVFWFWYRRHTWEK